MDGKVEGLDCHSNEFIVNLLILILLNFSGLIPIYFSLLFFCYFIVLVIARILSAKIHFTCSTLKVIDWAIHKVLWYVAQRFLFSQLIKWIFLIRIWCRTFLNALPIYDQKSFWNLLIFSYERLLNQIIIMLLLS